MNTNKSLNQIDALIKDATTEISENIDRLQWGSSLDHADKAETITRFAKALEALMLHKAQHLPRPHTSRRRRVPTYGVLSIPD